MHTAHPSPSPRSGRPEPHQPGVVLDRSLVCHPPPPPPSKQGQHLTSEYQLRAAWRCGGGGGFLCGISVLGASIKRGALGFVREAARRTVSLARSSASLLLVLVQRPPLMFMHARSSSHACPGPGLQGGQRAFEGGGCCEAPRNSGEVGQLERGRPFQGRGWDWQPASGGSSALWPPGAQRPSLPPRDGLPWWGRGGCRLMVESSQHRCRNVHLPQASGRRSISTPHFSAGTLPPHAETRSPLWMNFRSAPPRSQQAGSGKNALSIREGSPEVRSQPGGPSARSAAVSLAWHEATPGFNPPALHRIPPKNCRE